MLPKRSPSRVGLTWLLCLLAWRGPVPVVHSHSLDSHELAANEYLAEHAVLYHSHDISRGIDHGRGGWHLHFVLPGNPGTPLQGLPGEGPDEPNIPSFAWSYALLEIVGIGNSIAGSGTEGVSAGINLDQTAVFQLDPTSSRLPGRCMEHQSAAHVPSEQKRISPHARLCVARC